MPSQEPPLLEVPSRGLEERHEKLRRLRRERLERMPPVGEYRDEAPPSQPVSRLVYWIVGLAGAAVLGSLLLAWYLAGTVVQLATAGSEREERLLGVLERLTERASESNDGSMVMWIIVLIILIFALPGIIAALMAVLKGSR